MHLSRVHRSIIHFSIVAIGCCFLSLKDLKAQEAEKAEELGLVEVEPSNVRPSGQDIKLVPYDQRRTRWGTLIGISVSSFLPENHTPFFYPESKFKEVYGKQAYRMIDLHLTLKRNLSSLSIGLDVGAGSYAVSGQKTFTSDLSVIPIRMGLQLALDALTSEPFIVPYASVGAYTALFSEKGELNGEKTTNRGNSATAPYFAAGLLFSLNWLDPETASTSYLDAGIENTFLFVEARSFSKGSAKDPNLTGLHLNAGMKLEL